jgi:hypothetical protein
MKRLPGWEERLGGVFTAATAEPYRLGVHDCLRVACMAVEALTGEDHWPRFARSYATKREALAVIRTRGDSLGEAVSAVLGVPDSDRLLARRGDLVLYRDDAGEHLGVCGGMQVGVTGPAGLVWVPLIDPRCLRAWRIG